MMVENDGPYTSESTRHTTSMYLLSTMVFCIVRFFLSFSVSRFFWNTKKPAFELLTTDVIPRIIGVRAYASDVD